MEVQRENMISNVTNTASLHDDLKVLRDRQLVVIIVVSTLTLVFVSYCLVIITVKMKKRCMKTTGRIPPIQYQTNSLSDSTQDLVTNLLLDDVDSYFQNHHRGMNSRPKSYENHREACRPIRSMYRMRSQSKVDDDTNLDDLFIL
jgi:hypothetical protein